MKRTLASLPLAIFICVVGFLTPDLAVAQGTVFNVCQGNICTTCHLVTLIKNLLNYLTLLAILFGTIMFVYAGFQMVTASGNMSKIAKAKAIFIDVIIGIVIVLAAYMIVDTVMRLLVGDDLLGGGPWSYIDCTRSPNPTPTSPGPGWKPGDQPPLSNNPPVDGGTVVVGPTGPTLTAQEARSSLSGADIGIQGGVNLDGVNADMTSTLLDVKNDTGFRLEVSSARDGQHQNTCHAQGTCFDVVCRDCSGPTQLQTFIEKTQSHGYCAVYEPGPAGACPSGVRPCLPGVGTGAHFSFYMNPSQSGSCRL